MYSHRDKKVILTMTYDNHESSEIRKNMKQILNGGLYTTAYVHLYQDNKVHKNRLELDYCSVNSIGESP